MKPELRPDASNRYPFTVIRFSPVLAALGSFLALRMASAQHVQPGDRLAVRIFGGEQLVADTLIVSGSGNVVLPKLGVVPVADFPIASLPDSLRARYAHYLRTPTVDVVVLRRVVVNGEVKKPDIYYVDVATTLNDVIAHAGGFNDNANDNRVFLRRGGHTTRLPDWRSSSASVAQLQSGDEIYVARRSWLMLNLLPAATALGVVASIIITLRR